MTGLGDTLSNLAFMRRAKAAAAAKPGANRAQIGHLQAVEPSGSNPGALRMLCYVPPGLRRGGPLVVVLHGCTQDAAGYDHGSGWSALADRHGFALLFPEQQRANNAQLCFNWYQPADVTRDSGEALSIRQMVAQMVAAHGLDPARVYVTGLSAGGAMTAAMLACYPEVFAGGAIIAGLPYGAATNVQQALEAMFQVRRHNPREWGDLVRAASPHRGARPPVQVWHGDADATVKPGNAEEALKQWADVLGAAPEPVTDQVDRAMHRAYRAQGKVVLEGFTVPGMGHGTPLDTHAADFDRSVGAAGPHMLEAGINSTWHIARSWGLLTQAARVRTGAAAPARPHATSLPGLAIAARVNGIIGNALRAAGLPTSLGGS